MHVGKLKEVQSGLREVPVEANRLVNLDANASAPATAAVIEAVVEAFRDAANPSSAHAGGEAARTILARARDAVASLATGMDEDGVVFTSGCTEANNTVLNLVRTRGGTLVTTEVEHPSILEPARALASEGFDVRCLKVDGHGLVDLAELEALFGAIEGPVLLSVQTANSETGVMQPIAAIAGLFSHVPDLVFHTDAAQAFGKVSVPVSPSGPHVATVSGHKLHAPMGVGALLFAPGDRLIPPLLRGGEQQGGSRAGTEPIPAIAGMAAACEARQLRLEQDVSAMRASRDRLESGILAAVPGAVVNGARAPRLPNTTSISFPHMDAMALVAMLDAEGVLASQGSACSSMRPEPSHVLLAMGLSEDQAFSTVRFSTSPLNTDGDVDIALAAIVRAVRKAGVFQ